MQGCKQACKYSGTLGLQGEGPAIKIPEDSAKWSMFVFLLFCSTRTPKGYLKKKMLDPFFTRPSVELISNSEGCSMAWLLHILQGICRASVLFGGDA